MALYECPKCGQLMRWSGGDTLGCYKKGVHPPVNVVQIEDTGQEVDPAYDFE